MKIQEQCASKSTKLDNLPFQFAVTDVPAKGVVFFYISLDGTLIDWCGKNVSSASIISKPQSEKNNPWKHIVASKERVILADLTNTIRVYNIEDDERGKLHLRETNRVSVYEPGSKLDMTKDQLITMTMDETNRVILHYDHRFFIFTAWSDAYMTPSIIATYKDLTYQDMVISGNRLYALRFSNTRAEFERDNYPFVVDVYKLTRQTIEHIYAHKSTMNGYPRSFCASGKRSLVIQTNTYMHTFHLPS